MIITVTLTDTEFVALEYAALSPIEWATNAITNRARIAIDEIVQIVVQKCLDGGIAIPGTKEEMVALAYTNAWIKTAQAISLETPTLPIV
jgi:hypothetical protein